MQAKDVVNFNYTKTRYCKRIQNDLESARSMNIGIDYVDIDSLRPAILGIRDVIQV